MATKKKLVDVFDSVRNGSGNGAAPAPQPPRIAKQIVLPTLDIRMIEVTLEGDSPLVVHRMSEKARKQMLDKQMGVPSEGREKRDPHQDYLDSMYRLPDGTPVFRAIAFKDAAVSACTSLGKSVTKVAARQAFHVLGPMVRIEGTPRMREDVVKIGQDTSDFRFRAEFPEWRVTLAIKYNARVLSAEQVVNMLNTAGFAVGVGEYRPERNGDCGMFHVA